MIIKKHVILLALLFIVASYCHASRDFQLNLWKNYKLNQKNIVISHSSQSYSITFADRLQGEWKKEYQVEEEKIFIEFARNSERLLVVGDGSQLVIRGFVEGERILLSESLLSAQNYELVFSKNGAVANVQISTFGELAVANFDSLIFRIKDSAFGSNFEQEQSRVTLESEKKLGELFAVYKINDTFLSFGRNMLSKTFSQLCVEEHKDLSFIGFCYNVHEGKRHNAAYKVDIRYSALLIDRLLGIYPKTALFLFEELVGLIQDQIFYSDANFVEIPEHISLIRGFVATLKEKNLGEPKLNSRVKSLLNGLMNQMLLADVNNLEEEINYREKNKMHPTLVKMLSLKWRSHSRKNALSSTYEESFTPDYFYNYANQHLDSCVSKVAWLTAATAEYVLLIKAIGNQDDFDALQQPTSLFKILQHVTTSDSHAKQGRYYSINSAEGVRVYVEQVGYESFLPYTYELTNIFPEEFLRNVTTSFGLASLNLNHAKLSSKFDFRGNIQLYFNYKLLFEARRRLQSSKHQRALGAVLDLISKIRAKIMDFQSRGEHYTSWTTSGQGMRERENLALLSLLFMGEKR